MISIIYHWECCWPINNHGSISTIYKAFIMPCLPTSLCLYEEIIKHCLCETDAAFSLSNSQGHDLWGPGRCRYGNCCDFHFVKKSFETLLTSSLHMCLLLCSERLSPKMFRSDVTGIIWDLELKRGRVATVAFQIIFFFFWEECVFALGSSLHVYNKNKD